MVNRTVIDNFDKSNHFGLDSQTLWLAKKPGRDIWINQSKAWNKPFVKSLQAFPAFWASYNISAEIWLVHLFPPVVLIGQISKFDYCYNANI